MKKSMLVLFAMFSIQAVIAQSSLDHASGGYLNNNDPTPAPAGSETVSPNTQTVTPEPNNSDGMNNSSANKPTDAKSSKRKTKNSPASQNSPDSQNQGVTSTPKKEK